MISIPSLTRDTEVPTTEINEEKKWISFWPGRFSTSYLLRKKVDIGIRDFSALYQQDPITSTGMIFKPVDFRYAKLSDFEDYNGTKEPLYRKQHIELMAFVDPAFSSDKDSDDAAIAI